MKSTLSRLINILTPFICVEEKGACLYKMTICETTGAPEELFVLQLSTICRTDHNGYKLITYVYVYYEIV